MTSTDFAPFSQADLQRHLFWSIYDGNLEKVKSLIQMGADIEKKNDKGCTALNYAVAYGQEPIAIYLIKKGAQLEERNLHGRTPLMLAVCSNLEKTVRLMIDKGADVNKAVEGQTPLECARGRGHLKIAAMISTAIEEKTRIAMEKREAERKKAFRVATVLQRPLPYKKSPFRVKGRTP